jgi:hypothetical protein
MDGLNGSSDSRSQLVRSPRTSRKSVPSDERRAHKRFDAQARAFPRNFPSTHRSFHMWLIEG